MIVCFECSRETKKKLDRLLEAGGYADYSEAISSSIENSLLLQEKVLQDGAVVIEATLADKRKMSLQASFLDSVIPSERHQKTERRKSPRQIPDIFLPEEDQPASPPLADLPSDMWMKGQKIPVDRWVFGQYNKLLPAKASCRALMTLMSSSRQGVPLEEATKSISDAAVKLGDFLKAHDEQNKLKRDNALAVAFPTSGDGNEKSRRRYASQFVASTNKHGQMSGLPFDLKLLNRTSRKATHLLLTEPGWKFAKLQNPVLDGMQEDPTQKLSDDERQFLLGHVARVVPAEVFAYQSILRIILEGVDTPSEIDLVLHDRVSENKKEDLSDSFLSSQRSGAVSRMEDLGLVKRVRNGIRISYAIMEAGEIFLSNND